MRTILVALSIAIGLFAIGLVAESQVILSHDLSGSYEAIMPASATLVTDAFDDDLVQAVERMPEVSLAEGGRRVTARLNTGPNMWRPLRLLAISDYADMRINKLHPMSGAWPPPKHDMLLERSALNLIHANVGSQVMIELPDGTRRNLQIAGLVHDLSQPAAFLTNALTATLPFGSMIQALVVILGMLGALSLFLSVFLVLNTIAALPLIRQGRWLVPGDTNAIVIDSGILKDERDLTIGSDLVLKIEGRELSFRVVGIIMGQIQGAVAYVDYPAFARAVRDVGRGNRVVIASARHDVGFETQMAQTLEQRFKSDGLRISVTETREDLRALTTTHYNVVVILLLVMAIVLGAVGGLGLMGTMSLNVLERTREIGLMRAIGATSRAIRQIVVVEGVLIGIFSWQNAREPLVRSIDEQLLEHPSTWQGAANDGDWRRFAGRANSTLGAASE
ncbi:MAG TPA: ABC transporter permease [Roseiflexaceae bacterium]|nr:ABC transporter permease [Roseiflexaceae bacterium]